MLNVSAAEDSDTWLEFNEHRKRIRAHFFPQPTRVVLLQTQQVVAVPSKQDIVLVREPRVESVGSFEHPADDVVTNAVLDLLAIYAVRRKTGANANATLDAIAAGKLRCDFSNFSYPQLQTRKKFSTCELCLCTTVTVKDRVNAVNCSRCAYCPKCAFALRSMSGENDIHCVTRARGKTSKGASPQCGLRSKDKE